MELSPRYCSFESTYDGKPYTKSGFFEWTSVCEKFVCATCDSSIPVDQFMKERISFFEIAFVNSTRTFNKQTKNYQSKYWSR